MSWQCLLELIFQVLAFVPSLASACTWARALNCLHACLAFSVDGYLAKCLSRYPEMTCLKSEKHPICSSHLGLIRLHTSKISPRLGFLDGETLDSDTMTSTPASQVGEELFREVSCALKPTNWLQFHNMI